MSHRILALVFAFGGLAACGSAVPDPGDTSPVDIAPPNCDDRDPCTFDSWAPDLGCVHDKIPGCPALDVVFVVEDSAWVSDEQLALARSVGRFVERLRGLGLDLRIGVTTTDLCPRSIFPDAARGRFVYQPVGAFISSTRVSTRVACLVDDDCRQNPAPPDPGHWKCSVQGGEENLYLCDHPGAPESGILFPARSYCDYSCGAACKIDADCGDGGPCVDRSCDPLQCERAFGTGYRCQDSGCIAPTGNDPCPPSFKKPPVLDMPAADEFARTWIRGEWAGEPAWEQKNPGWKALPLDDAGWTAREPLRNAVFERLLQCLVVLGRSNGASCGIQEHGLEAAWKALDRDGENGYQAKAFLRNDAYLLIVTMSIVEDCSVAVESADPYEPTVASEDIARCGCLYDEEGCTSGERLDGTCDDPLGKAGEAPLTRYESRCVTDGKYDAKKCPLMSVTKVADRLKSVKADPSKVLFAALGGAPRPGDDVSVANATIPQLEARYLDCKCPSGNSWMYVCQGALGEQELSLRYLQVLDRFGDHGIFGNLCDPRGLGGLLDDVAAKVESVVGR